MSAFASFRSNTKVVVGLVKIVCKLVFWDSNAVHITITDNFQTMFNAKVREVFVDRASNCSELFHGCTIDQCFVQSGATASVTKPVGCYIQFTLLPSRN
jgi:hypothetical protein